MNHNLHYIGINPALISSFSQLPLMPSLCDKLLHAVLFPSSEECGAHNGGGAAFRSFVQIVPSVVVNRERGGAAVRNS